MSLSLVILAAGIGRRYGGLKQIDPIGPNGEVLMDYSVYDAILAGFDRIVFVIRKDMEAEFRTVVGDRLEDRVDVGYAYQELDMLPDGFRVPAGRSKPWGTGQALLCAREAVATPFGVINADDFYGRDAFRVLAGHMNAAGNGEVNEYSMVGFRLADTLSDHGPVARGVCETSADGLLIAVEELTGIERTAEGARHEACDGTVRRFSGCEMVSMNMWGFTPSVFGYLDEQFRAFLHESGAVDTAEFFIPSAVNDLVSRDLAGVRVLRATGSWFGVTYRGDVPRAVEGIRALLEAGIYPADLREGNST
jgi:hypothetical protein